MAVPIYSVVTQESQWEKQCCPDSGSVNRNTLNVRMRKLNIILPYNPSNKRPNMADCTYMIFLPLY